MRPRPWDPAPWMLRPVRQLPEGFVIFYLENGYFCLMLNRGELGARHEGEANCHAMEESKLECQQTGIRSEGLAIFQIFEHNSGSTDEFHECVDNLTLISKFEVARLT